MTKQNTCLSDGPESCRPFSRQLIFRLDKLYGAAVDKVQEVLRASSLTADQGTVKSNEILGTVSLRGEAVPVISLERRLVLKDSQITSRSRILIAAFGSSKLGLLVNEAVEVIDLEPDAVKKGLSEGRGAAAELVLGVSSFNGEELTLIDLNRI